MVLQPSFLSDNTFGQGYIHKMITIDTPHLGTPLASRMLSSSEVGGCVERLLARKGAFVINSVGIGGFALVDGAVNNLATGSQALANIANQGPRPLPTGLIAGTQPHFIAPDALAIVCSAVGDPLAQADVSGSLWSSVVFGDEPNDAIVPISSQLDGLSGGFTFSGVVHSTGSEWPLGLGFGPPSVLDRDAQTGIPSTVIQLLNTPIADGTFRWLNP